MPDLLHDLPAELDLLSPGPHGVRSGISDQLPGDPHTLPGEPDVVPFEPDALPGNDNDVPADVDAVSGLPALISGRTRPA